MTDRQDTLLRTPLCDLLGCDHPVLLAGMGGVSRWELAAAVANAGGYGMLGMVREPPDQIRREVTAMQAATDRPFAVNVIPAATEPRLLEAQIDCCLDLGVSAFCFFWEVMPEVVARVKRAGCLVLHQVGTIEAARLAEETGVDVIIAHDNDQPRLRFSTDSPLRTTTGDLEAMALYAGQGAGDILDIVPAATRLHGITTRARQLMASTIRNDGKAIS